MSLGLSGVGWQKGFYWIHRHDKREHVLIFCHYSISVSHTVFPLLSHSFTPSTAAPYQSLAWRCLTQSFVKLPLFKPPPPPLISSWPGFPLCAPLAHLPPSMIQVFAFPQDSKFSLLDRLDKKPCNLAKFHEVFTQTPHIMVSTVGENLIQGSGFAIFSNQHLKLLLHRPLFPNPIFLPTWPSPHFTPRLNPSFQSQAPASCLS